MIEEIKSIDWDAYHGPEFYHPYEVSESLSRLVRLSEEEERTNVYHAVLSALGNNHGGTYYPAIMSALPIVMKIALNSHRELSRNCALEMMSDWYFSFDPELGTYAKINNEELRFFVKNGTRNFVNEHPKVDSERNLRLILELDESMKEENDQ